MTERQVALIGSIGLPSTQIRVKKLDEKSCEGLDLRVNTVSHQCLKTLQVKRRFFSVAYEAKGMRFCTQVPKDMPA